jgi:hypothetical protein
MHDTAKTSTTQHADTNQHSTACMAMAAMIQRSSLVLVACVPIAPFKCTICCVPRTVLLLLLLLLLLPIAYCLYCCRVFINAAACAQVRTSTGTFFDNGFDDIITSIEERVALVTMLPRGAAGTARHSMTQHGTARHTMACLLQSLKQA